MAPKKDDKPTAKAGDIVSGADWSEREITGQSHTRVTFVDLDLTEATVSGSTFTECTFKRAKFNASKIDDSAFTNWAKFNKCDLRGSDLGSLDPMMVELRGAIVSLEQAVVIAGALGLDVRPDD